MVVPSAMNVESCPRHQSYDLTYCKSSHVVILFFVAERVRQEKLNIVCVPTSFQVSAHERLGSRCNACIVKLQNGDED